ncbi:methyltransferase domain-containing protein (plasmid) [Paraburkholderia sp. PREW-6R]|uniref:methyltransferase domain-containing protein n=1 Tax=Paraburkholderia sp. PREW-6R TaxID=3141544 RepID=UPI0031F4F8C8
MRDPLFCERYLAGEGIDIGCGETPLSLFADRFPSMGLVRGWDIVDGDAQFMAGVQDESFDFVHSSHCLEHLEDPREALRHWLRILKPGGFLIVTVPDEDLYERGHWPSWFNATHKWSFTVYKPQSPLPRSLNVLDLYREFSQVAECERVVQLRHDFDDHAAPGVDQSLGDAECAIEWVWRKREAAPVTGKSAADWLAEGLIAEHQDRNDQSAEAAMRRACAFEPPSFDAYNALAHLLSRQGRLDECEALWREATRRMPGQQTRMYLALFLLQRGNYREGFRIREASIADARRTPTAPDVEYPRWQGQSLAGRSIVIWTEFGLGDELMFARFAGELKHKLGASRVSVLCQDPLYPALRDGLAGADLVLPVSMRASLPEHDFWVFPHSIPLYLDLQVDAIPRAPYVKVDNAARLRWSEKMNLPADTLKVGIVWQGNPTHENDAFRSFGSLALLQPVLELPGIDFVTLQKGRGEEEARQLATQNTAVHALGHEFADFSDTAAAIACLDLVISVDTSVAHLAAAMGKPVWLLLPTVSDWRWMLGRQDSPWYDRLRIFRQARLADWSGVLSEVKAGLHEMMLSVREK